MIREIRLMDRKVDKIALRESITHEIMMELDRRVYGGLDSGPADEIVQIIFREFRPIISDGVQKWIEKN